ncbi:MAG: type II toxin-antitoxin system RelE/ParE family toxin [Tepidisphaeraceae bacterium]|jgi:mRNA-degrading endonuclease RelE of RelBE toxin-antitoxin system
MHVGLTAEAAAQYNKLPRSIQPRIDNIILRLVQWPKVSGVKPLVGRLAGNLRIRAGDYRIVFRVSGDKVIVWKIGNRKDVYLE